MVSFKASNGSVAGTVSKVRP